MIRKQNRSACASALPAHRWVALFRLVGLPPNHGPVRCAAEEHLTTFKFGLLTGLRLVCHRAAIGTRSMEEHSGCSNRMRKNSNFL